MLKQADSDFISALMARIPGLSLRDPAPYLSEPRGRFAGDGQVLAPADTAGVSAVMAACHEARLPVVPYAGGTGLVGGQVMEGAPLILSVERLNDIRDIDPVANLAELGAGVILDDLRAAVEKLGRLFPLALASGGSARLGGLLATNAGGVNVLRYGMARDLCLGVEAVLADGRIYRGLSGLRKDNTGYDLRDLLIGSEGTLGVITAASLRLVPRPASEAVALLALPSPEAALTLLALAQEQFGEGVSAFELISRQGIDFMQETGVPIRFPMATIPDWMVLIELGLGAGQQAGAAMERLFVEAAERDLVSDGVVAANEAQRAALWALREHIPEGNQRIGAISSHDISVPIPAIPDFIRRGAERIGPDMRINCFGHLGDGNLHYNVFPAPGRAREAYDRAAVQRQVHDLVAEFGGSISAEHGIGRLKTGDLLRYADPVKMEMMRAIKAALDPRGILNPGVILDQSPA